MSAHLADIDHVIRVEHRGGTVEIDLSALCRSSHQDEDDGCVDVERTADGTLPWSTTRWGGRVSEQASIRIRRRPRVDDPDERVPWGDGA